MDNLQTKQAILAAIKKYNRIIITRHLRPDGDAVGSTLGLSKILKLSFPDKEIYVTGDDHSDYVAFLGAEDSKLADEMYKGALLMVLDTAGMDRISNSQVSLADCIVKIDHHVDIAPYGDISWVEDTRSSVCEMITDFYLTFKDELKCDKEVALCLYTGMVTDSGRFKFPETSGDTLRCAAALLDMGIDTETLFARLYLEEYSYRKYAAYVYENMNITENGVAWIYVDSNMQQQFNLSREDASATIGMLDEIKGSIIWIAFIDNQDGTIRVRLRSRFVTINKLAEKYSGGGHLCAAGATVHNMDEINALLSDADALIKEFKANNFYL